MRARRSALWKLCTIGRPRAGLPSQIVSTVMIGPNIFSEITGPYPSRCGVAGEAAGDRYEMCFPFGIVKNHTDVSLLQLPTRFRSSTSRSTRTLPCWC